MNALRECPTCGMVFGRIRKRYKNLHLTRCEGAHPLERKYYQTYGSWPRNPRPQWMEKEIAQTISVSPQDHELPVNFRRGIIARGKKA